MPCDPGDEELDFLAMVAALNRRTLSRLDMEPKKPQEAAEPVYIKATTVAAMIDIAPSTVTNDLSKRPGFPRAYRFGRLLRWRREDIDEWIEAQRVKPAARRRQKVAA